MYHGVIQEATRHEKPFFKREKTVGRAVRVPMAQRGNTACDRCTGVYLITQLCVTMGSARDVNSRQLAKENGRCRHDALCTQYSAFAVLLSLPSREIYSPSRQAPCCPYGPDRPRHTYDCRSLSPARDVVLWQRAVFGCSPAGMHVLAEKGDTHKKERHNATQGPAVCRVEEKESSRGRQ